MSIFYALNILPLSSVLGRKFRTFSRKLRNKPCLHQQQTKLPAISWKQISGFKKPARLAETDKQNGNVSLQELAVLSGIAATVANGQPIIEIGTFDGRTTLNMAINCGTNSNIYTLDLPPETATAFEVEAGETAFINKPASGSRFTNPPGSEMIEHGKITQLYGDSATFDWSPYLGKAGLIFVDGSHAYDYARKDSETAFQLLAEGGTIVWHDYGVWEGVTRALEEIETEKGLGLTHIKGTSLVICRPHHV